MKRKQAPNQTPHNPKLIILVISIIISILTLFIYFAPGKGIYHQNKLEAEIVSLEEKNKLLVKKNSQLQQEIAKLENNDEYIEEIARKKHGLLKKNEILFEFKADENKK
jgi:cell division protein FtsB